MVHMLRDPLPGVGRRWTLFPYRGRRSIRSITAKDRRWSVSTLHTLSFGLQEIMALVSDEDATRVDQFTWRKNGGL